MVTAACVMGKKELPLAVSARARGVGAACYAVTRADSRVDTRVKPRPLRYAPRPRPLGSLRSPRAVDQRRGTLSGNAASAGRSAPSAPLRSATLIPAPAEAFAPSALPPLGAVVGGSGRFLVVPSSHCAAAPLFAMSPSRSPPKRGAPLAARPPRPPPPPSLRSAVLLGCPSFGFLASLGVGCSAPCPRGSPRGRRRQQSAFFRPRARAAKVASRPSPRSARWPRSLRSLGRKRNVCRPLRGLSRCCVAPLLGSPQGGARPSLPPLRAAKEPTAESTLSRNFSCIFQKMCIFAS